MRNRRLRLDGRPRRSRRVYSPDVGVITPAAAPCGAGSAGRMAGDMRIWRAIRLRRLYSGAILMGCYQMPKKCGDAWLHRRSMTPPLDIVSPMRQYC